MQQADRCKHVTNVCYSCSAIVVLPNKADLETKSKSYGDSGADMQRHDAWQFAPKMQWPSPDSTDFAQHCPGSGAGRRANSGMHIPGAGLALK